MTARGSAWLVSVVFFSLMCVYGQVTTGTISGTVSDSSGAAIPGSQVVILNEETGVSRTLQADAAGRYSAPSLNPGRYRVAASLQGFQMEVRTGIQLTVGRAAIVNFALPVGTVTEQIEVTGEAPLVQTTEAAISYLVDDRTISELPLNGRDIAQLILLNPGVVQSQNGRRGDAEQGFAERLSVSGMRGEDNSYLLDGTYINDYFRHVPAGPTGALTGVETVREFQVLTSTFSAQYGRALGGVFNAVTKSGTNEWHGGAYEFVRSSALDARNFFDRQRTPSDPRLPPFRRDHFGATFGGPITRDRTFFFVAYEGLRETLTQTGTMVVPDLNARRGILPTQTVEVSQLITPFLKLYPEPTPGERNFGNGTAQYIFQAKQPTSEDFGQARIDYQLSERDSFFGRFTGNGSERARASGDLWQSVGAMATTLVTLSETHVFTPRMLNSFRLAFNRAVPRIDHKYLGPPVEPGQISVPGQPYHASIAPGSGISAVGGVQSAGSVFTTNRIALNDDVNLTLGSHSLQFGGMLERLQFNPNFALDPFGAWRFANLSSFLQAIPDRFSGTPPQIGKFRRGARQWFPALYLQDDWRVTPKLALNLGLRWEPYTVAKEVNGLIDNLRHLMDTAVTSGSPYWLNKSWLNFSPRFGFAWSPFQSGKTSLRGGIGLFFVPVDPSIYTLSLLRQPSLSPDIQVTTAAALQRFPNALEVIAASGQGIGGTGQRIFALPFENLRSPHALQYSLSLQQQIGDSSVLSLGYSGRRGMNLPALANFNVPTFQFNGLSLEMPAGLPNNFKVNPGFTAVRYISTSSDSWYNGFTAALERRFSAGLQARIAYTYSRATAETDGNENGASGTAGGVGTVKYPHNLSVSKGLSGYHLQNVFSASYTYELPFGRSASGWLNRILSGWQMTGIISLQDGQPFDVTAVNSSAMSDYNAVRSPNLKPGFAADQIVLGGPDKYFTLDAFTAPGPRELGNYGRNALIGPGLAQWDLGLTKNTQVGERWTLQFRAEGFNILNRTNFAAPNSSFNSIFGSDGVAIPSRTLITSTVTTGRQIQFGFKLIF